MADVLPSDELIDEPSDFGALRPGTRLGRYELLVPIARGGMARVWAARLHGQRGFQKLVAIKTILPHLADEAEFERMFLDEARIAAGVHHPNVCEIYELGEERKTLYLAMEWVSGDSLSRVLRPAGKTEGIDARVAARILADACAGAHAAHELTDEDGRQLGVVHRDLSPHNVLLSADGVVKVCDFGVAKALGQLHEQTSAGQLKGKISYMSPEQITGGAIDRRSDVFSLGVVLYEATTGRRAFVGEPLAVLNAVIDGRFVPPEQARPDYPAGLAAIVRRSLAHEVDLRHPGADVLARELEAFAATAGLDVSREALARELARRYGAPALPDLTLHHSDEPPSMPEDDATLELSTLRRATVAPKRSRWVLGGVALAAALGLGLAGWAIVPREPVEPPPTIAPAASEDIAPASIAPQTAAVPVPVMITAPKPTSQPPRVAAPTARTPPRNRRTSRAKPVTSSQPSRPESKLDPRDAMLPRSAR